MIFEANFHDTEEAFRLLDISCKSLGSYRLHTDLEGRQRTVNGIGTVPKRD